MDDGLLVGMTECSYDSVMEFRNDLQDLIQELASHPAIQQQAKILADITNPPIFDLNYDAAALHLDGRRLGDDQGADTTLNQGCTTSPRPFAAPSPTRGTIQAPPIPNHL